MKNNSIVFACISDIHFYDAGAWRLLDELRSEFLEVCKKRKNEIDGYFIIGDLFHTRVSMNGAAAAAVLLFMKELAIIADGKPIRVIKGTTSHDHSMLESLRFMQSDGVEVIDTLTTEEMTFQEKGNEYSLELLYLPEEYPQDWKEYYAEVLPAPDGKPFDIIFGHGMVDFAAHSSLLIESERQIKSAVVFPTDLLVDSALVSVFGHVHVAQSNKSIHYCGSFSRMAFGEEQQKGWLMLEMDGNTGESKIVRMKNTKAPIYKTLNVVDIMEDSSDVDNIAAEISGILQNSHLRIVVGNDVSNDMSTKVSMLREHFAEDNRFHIERRLLKVSTSTAEDDGDGLDFVRKNELPLDETIHRHISENKPNLCLTLEETRAIISPSDQTTRSEPDEKD
jgi:DNA repair exonuclease SbcCD nuclease subunit